MVAAASLRPLATRGRAATRRRCAGAAADQRTAAGAGRTASEVRTTLGGLDGAFAARGDIEAALGGGADLAGVAVAVRDGVAALPTGSPELGAVLAAERCAWRVTSASRAGEDVVVRGLAVMDAREHGLWARVAPAEPLADARPSPETEVVLVRRSPAELWRTFGALLPGGGTR